MSTTFLTNGRPFSIERVLVSGDMGNGQVAPIVRMELFIVCVQSEVSLVSRPWLSDCLGVGRSDESSGLMLWSMMVYQSGWSTYLWSGLGFIPRFNVRKPRPDVGRDARRRIKAGDSARRGKEEADFGSLNEGKLIRKSGRAGMSPASTDRGIGAVFTHEVQERVGYGRHKA